MRNTFPAVSMVAAILVIGCDPPPTPKPLSLAPPPFAVPTTQSDEVVADMSSVQRDLQVTRGELDNMLYEAYGLRMLFDIVELKLAKDTLKVQQPGATITPEEIQRERELTIKGIVDPEDKTPKASYDDLFNQFLQNEHLSKIEFEVKIVQTNAVLRKIVTPIVVGKLPDAAIHRAFEQLYGAKRQIADIELANVREAVVARNRLNGGEAFAHVAKAMSIDPQTAAMGGQWQPFSDQSPAVPQVIRDAAFSMEKGEISDIIQADGKYHIIQLLASIEPKLVKYEDAKADVQKQLEDQLITMNMKKLREELTATAQQQLRFDDPVLKAQWDELIDQQKSKIRDRDSALKKLNETTTHPTAEPAATQP